MTRRASNTRRLRQVAWVLPVMLFVAMTDAAGETLEGLLARLQFHETQRLAYRETRHMQLLSEPWQATGDLYIAAHRLVIVQQDPRRTVTEITAARLRHIDVENDNVTRLPLKQPFGVPGLEPFLLLLFGNDGAGQLERAYQPDLHQDKGRWALYLQPVASADEQPAAMTLSGATGLQPDTLVLEFADGDITEWHFTPVSSGSEADAALAAVHTASDSGPDE